MLTLKLICLGVCLGCTVGQYILGDYKLAFWYLISCIAYVAFIL